MTVKRFDAHTNADDFKSDWHESKDGPMVRYEGYAALAAEIAELKKVTTEPVAWTDEVELRDVGANGFAHLFTVNPITPHADPRRVIKLFTAPPAPEAPDGYQHLSELYHTQEKRLFELAQRIKGPSFDKYAHSSSQAVNVLETALFGESDDEFSAAMHQGDQS